MKVFAVDSVIKADRAGCEFGSWDKMWQIFQLNIVNM